MNNTLDFQFGMYEPATDSIIVNTGKNVVLIIRCKECNSSVTFDNPNDVVISLSAGRGSTSSIYQTGIERKRIAGLCGCYE